MAAQPPEPPVRPQGALEVASAPPGFQVRASASRSRLVALVAACREHPEHAAIWLLGALFCALRFVGLETSPPGFFGDEIRAALHQVCLWEEGRSAYGQRWPLFVVGAGDGLYTPPFLYLGMLWLKLLGPSIASCRALAATFTLLTTVAVSILARQGAGPTAARYAFLAASISPWAFQFARIAWDPPLAPAFLLFAIVCFRARAHRGALVVAAICFALALYSYPPSRVQAPLIFGPWLAWGLWQRRVSLRDVLVFSVVGLVVSAPLLRGTFDGSLMRRGSSESIFSADFIANQHSPHAPAVVVLQAFLDNLHAHFRPAYLFFAGDENLRHSTRMFGVFSLLDDLALILGAIALAAAAYACARRSPARAPSAVPSDPARARGRLLAFSAWGYLCGVVPAALCWSGVPHALRSIGSWPFLALVTGTLLAAAELRAGRRVAWLAIAVALTHAALFIPAYFEKYPPTAGYWYDLHAQQVMRAGKGERAARLELARSFPEAVRYYAIADRDATCAQSREWVARIEAREQRRTERAKRRTARARPAPDVIAPLTPAP